MNCLAVALSHPQANGKQAEVNHMLLRKAKFGTRPAEFIDANTLSSPYAIVDSIDVECECGERWIARHSDQERRGFVTPQPYGSFLLRCRKCWRSVVFVPDEHIRAGGEFDEPQPEPKP